MVYRAVKIGKMEERGNSVREGLYVNEIIFYKIKMKSAAKHCFSDVCRESAYSRACLMIY